MLDLVGAACDFAFANLLHGAEIRELAVRVPNDTTKEDIAQAADTDTIKGMTGYAKFCGIDISDVGNTAKIKHQINYLRSDPSDPTSEISAVELTTTVNFRPFLRIPMPFLPGVPGLNEDLPFKISSTRPQEEKGKNG
jgi:hypothetical protein